MMKRWLSRKPHLKKNSRCSGRGNTCSVRCRREPTPLADKGSNSPVQLLTWSVCLARNPLLALSHSSPCLGSLRPHSRTHSLIAKLLGPSDRMSATRLRTRLPSTPLTHSLTHREAAGPQRPHVRHQVAHEAPFDPTHALTHSPRSCWAPATACPPPGCARGSLRPHSRTHSLTAKLLGPSDRMSATRLRTSRLPMPRPCTAGLTATSHTVATNAASDMDRASPT
jgi:hypothetical protein